MTAIFVLVLHVAINGCSNNNFEKIFALVLVSNVNINTLFFATVYVHSKHTTSMRCIRCCFSISKLCFSSFVFFLTSPLKIVFVKRETFNKKFGFKLRFFCIYKGYNV